MTKITRYFDEGGAGEGGQGGTGAPAGAQGTEDAVAKEQETLSSLLDKPEASLTAEEKATLETLKGKYDIQEVDETGKPLTADQKAAIEATSKKLDAIKAKPETQRTLEEIKFLKDNTEETVSVYQQVDELVGEPLDVDYGDTDPMSPEGIVKREEVIRDRAVAAYDTELKEKYPLAYNFFLHLQANGKPEEFFQTQSDDFSTINLTKPDVATQETIYRKALAVKGNSQEQIDALITYAKDKGKLFEYSKMELEGLQRRQEEQQKVNAAKVAQTKQREAQLTNTFFTNLDKTLEKAVQGVVIPKAERKAFTDFISSQVTLVNGNLVYFKQLDPNNLIEDIAANYFRFKKGDLSKIVENKAKDLNVKQTKGKIKYNFIPKASGGSPNKNYVPLGEL